MKVMNRRDLFRTAAALGVGDVAPASANDRIGVGIIGCGGMGRMDQTDFQKNPDVEVVAVADVYRPNLERALEMTGRKAASYTDYRRLLENRQVQAVVVATPDHWHPLITVDACNAGKDVYVEKPVSRCLREGRLMVEAARRNDRVVQVGLQQRSGTHFQRAAKFIQEGKLGKVHYAQCWNHEILKPEGLGNPPDSNPPEGMDWDFWLGPAAKVPFNKSYHPGNWRWFYNFGGGKLTDWGPHLVDIVHWAMQTDAPLSAAASGGKLFVTDNRDTPDTIGVIFEYPGFLLHYSSLVHNTYGHDGNAGSKPFGSYGIQFHGSLGTLFVDRAGYAVTPQLEARYEPGGETFHNAFDDLTGTGLYYTGEGKAEKGTTSLQHLPHVRNFLDCVKSRQKPIADIEIGHRATAACHLGNIAYRLGQKIRWDAKAEKILDNEAANRMLTRPYRAPWKLEGLS
jgi:predicted dehydrogenase